MCLNDFEVNSKLLFSNHNVLIFGNDKSIEFNEIVKIAKNAQFKNVFSTNSYKNAKSIILDADISIVFLDMTTITNIKNIREISSGKNIKIFLIVENINNELFKLNLDEFIFNPSIKKERTILKLIFKNLAFMENEINIELNNQRITEQQKNFDKIFELLSNNSLITRTDTKGKIIYANEIFQQISGYKKNEVLGKNHSIIRHENTSDSIIDEIWNAISNKNVWSGILRNKTKKGHDYIVETKIIPELDMFGQVTSYLSVQYDITTLVHNNELAKLLMDEQSSPVLIGQIGKGLIDASKEFLTQFGFDDLLGFSNNKTSLLDLAYDLSNQDNSNIEKFRNYETVTLHNVKLYTNFDTVKIYDVIQKRIITPFGNYFIITLNDITMSQKEVADAKNEAAVKSNFLATMSHEIRTPLNGMTPYIYLLLESGDFNNEQLDYINTIKESSESLLRIINDILDFSKIESGKLEIENISFEPVREFETVVDLYVAKANEKKISLFTYIEPTLPHLIGDPLRIKQIINNLLSNAIKFTPENGEIIFSVENISKTKDIVELNIYVKDNGKGIDEGHQENIFTPFSQADNSISRKYGGTGLGLSISSDLAKTMGGSISLQSSLGNGSKFTLNLKLEIDKDNAINKYKNENKHIIGVYSVDESKYKCEVLLLCKYLKAMKFAYKKIVKVEDANNCDVIFVISSGSDNIPHFSESFTKNTKVITILGSTIENMNKFHSTAIIQMPINGSKIYDAIVDIERLHKQNEYLLKYSNKSIVKYNAHVLVAEDFPTNQKIIKTLLAKNGITVDIAENGKIALDKYINEITNNVSNYDLVLLDIHMPIMDGLESISKMREFEKENNMTPIDIVALTADAIKTHQQHYLESGFTDFLAKPIEIEKYEEALRKYLSDKIVSNTLPEINNTKSNFVCPEIKDEHKDICKTKVQRVCENLGLDEDSVRYLIDDFMFSWEKNEISLNNAINELDFENIRSISHSLKGASGSLRLDDVYESCKELEEMGRERIVTDILIYKECFYELKRRIEN